MSKRRSRKGESSQGPTKKRVKSSEPTDSETSMPRKNVLLFAPGASLPSSSPWMEEWSRRLSSFGETIRFDYKGRGGKAERHIPHHLDQAVTASRQLKGDGKLVLAGKSMGSRVGVHVATENEGLAAAVICFGYPLKGANGSLRDKILLELKTPILFIAGSKDRMCPIPLLEEVRSRMTARSELVVVEGGDHSILVPSTAKQRASGRTQDVEDDRVTEAISSFLQSCGVVVG